MMNIPDNANNKTKRPTAVESPRIREGGAGLITRVTDSTADCRLTAGGGVSRGREARAGFISPTCKLRAGDNLEGNRE